MGWLFMVMLAASIGFNTLSIIYLMRRCSLLEGSSKPRPTWPHEYLARRKGSAK